MLEAQARRGIAIGGIFPQQQEAFGTYQRVGISDARANQAVGDHFFSDWQAGFDAAWEIDLWGRFRRGIESSDAELLASIASYDDAAGSPRGRGLGQLHPAPNARGTPRRRERQRRDPGARLRHRRREVSRRRGDRTRLGAGALAARRYAGAHPRSRDQHPADREHALDPARHPAAQPRRPARREPRGDPRPPASIALGVPADLLRRRPDVRVAERTLAAQSAQIGVAKADLLPRFALVGTVSVAAEDFPDLFEGRSFENFGGPSVRWAILNYGRITNNVRVQDARFQGIDRRVRDDGACARKPRSKRARRLPRRAAPAHLRRAQRRRGHQRRCELAEIQYREGAYDYTRVLDTQQFLVTEEDRMVNTKGAVGVALTALYKALGGGWEIRMGQEFVADDQKSAMRERTRWGGMLDADRQEHDAEGAASGTEARGGGFQPRAWWPWW